MFKEYYRDQRHLRVLVYSNPKIPERTPAILGSGENPPPIMVERDRLSEIVIEVLVPLPREQENLVMSAIYGESGIKAGLISLENKEKILRASNTLIEKGAQGIIAGCTEVRLAVQQSDLKVPFFDSLNILSLSAIRIAKAMPANTDNKPACYFLPPLFWPRVKISSLTMGTSKTAVKGDIFIKLTQDIYKGGICSERAA
jgi:hypothetical protein